MPPDLSLIIKAREGGPDYIYALMTGYEEEAPEGMELADGMNFNHFFPGQQIAMVEPLYDEAVEYVDGSPMTLEQHARDVTALPLLDRRAGAGRA